MAVNDEICSNEVGEGCETAATLVLAMVKRPVDRPSPVPNAPGNVSHEVHPHDDIEEHHHFHHGMESYDDVHGKLLGTERAIRARTFETEGFKRMKVHSKVDRSVAKFLGATVTTTKWIDTSKGDDHKLGYRARLAGREIKTSQRPESFAATPPFGIPRRDFCHMRIQPAWQGILQSVEHRH